MIKANKESNHTESQRTMTENQIGKIVVNTAIAIHKVLGTSLYEIVYEVVLTHELKKHGLNVERQVPVSIEYDGIKFDEGFRSDIIIENKVNLCVLCGFV